MGDADSENDTDLIRTPGVPSSPAGPAAPSRPSHLSAPLAPSGIQGIPSGVRPLPAGLPPVAPRNSGQHVIPQLGGVPNGNSSATAPSPPAAEPSSRMVLAGYELLSELGRGSSGTVYLARRSGGGPVALKVLAGKASNNQEARARFLREATVSSRVTHPGIVRVLDAGEAQGHLYIAMEFIAGTTLRDRLATSALTPLEAARVVSLVARAIEAAHAAGIVHRDLKPGNILLDRAGHPHVADFGLARDELSRDRLTLSGDVLGTPMYMAPEQVRGQRVERPADVWALGVILWESIAGKVPFTGRSFPEVAENIQRWSPIPPSSVAAYAVPRSLDILCLAALAADARSRPSAAELALELEGVANEVSSKQFVARPRRSWGIVLAGATAASVGLLLGAATMRQIDQGRERKQAKDTSDQVARATAESEALTKQLEEATRLARSSESDAKRSADLASAAKSLATASNDQLQRERVTWGGSLSSALDRAIDDLAVAPVSSASTALRARLLLHRGRVEEALRCCTDARLSVEEIEDDPELLRLEAEAHWLLNQKNEALILAERLARDDQKGARGLYAQMFLQLRTNQGPDIIQIVRQLEHTAEIDPHFADGLTLAATILCGLGAEDALARAQTDATAAIRIDPTNPEAYYQRSTARWARAVADHDRGKRVPLLDQEGIVRDLQAARTIDPRPEWFVYEGKMYCQFDRANEALTSLDFAAQLSSARTWRRALALTWRGNAHLLLKDPRRALDDWLEAIAASPLAAGEMLTYVPQLPPDLFDAWKKRVPPEFLDELRARESGERRPGR